MPAQRLSHEGHDFVGVADRHVEIEPIGHGGGGLPGVAVVAGVDGVDAGDDVDVLDDVGEQFGALLAEAAEGRIRTGIDRRIGMAHEDDRGRRLLLEEPGKPHADQHEYRDRNQPRSAPLHPPHRRPASFSAPDHVWSLAVLIADRALLDYGVFDLDDFSRRFPSSSSSRA